jgi:tetratricopeptide (TPR) repeat protein
MLNMPQKHGKRGTNDKARALELLSSGHVPQARTLLIQLCGNKKNDAEVLLALGVADGMLGNFSASERNLRKAVAIAPRQADAHYNLGKALQAQGKLDLALESYNAACRLQPGTAGFHNNLGNVLKDLGRYQEALAHISRAIEIEPATANYHYNLGHVLSRLGLRERAVAAYERALSLHPGFTNALVSLGNAHLSLDHLDDAVAAYTQALRVHPGNPGALAGKAEVLNRQGCFAEAGALLEPLLADHDIDAGVAATFTHLAIHIGRETDALNLVERLLTNPKLSDADRSRLHFALGFLHDRNRRYDQAFANYQQANNMRRSEFDAHAHMEHIDSIIETFSAEFITGAGHARNECELPVFIVGMPRSGTTLVEHILSTHPQVHGAGELDLINCIADTLPGRIATSGDPAHAVHGLTPELAESLATEYIDRLAAYAPTARRITDKMPANFMHLGLIDLLLPSARIIHCIRDPLDTCLSCYFQNFAGAHPYSNDLSSLAVYYRGYEKLMAHWRTVLRIPMLDVRYEDLVLDPDSTIPLLIDFCGLEWDDACLNFHRNQRTVATASYDQVRRPVYNTSIGRWRHYENNIGVLRDAIAGIHA